ncbi:AraC family transcriptional regulator [Aquimarina sp. BL5]|uniref:response regulator transcription factor n=1 Tax=Aquimarina sp. BL5 TaxID=1714860 RepID=UPI000E478D12|nr:response regulator transcription factor [Aquimarina sp. BL5]AXT53070.1 AraC family transcriptional regulator [Aquimarina sp. BL5]RKM92140.1 helix-turn-helix domain-containing protein [Aquimarina sp. BL5]
MYAEPTTAIEINITAKDTEGTVRQIQEVIGGRIEERWGEYELTVNNLNAHGSIRFITFDWGVNLLEYDIIFHKEFVLVMDASEYNPIHFAYCLTGHCGHRFGFQNEVHTLEQFQSVIVTSRDGGYNYGYFPKEEKLEINVIQIARKKYLKKRLNNVSQLNERLYKVFMDEDHEKAFAYFGTFNLKLADQISALRKIKQKGMIRILQIEGMIYQILSMHIQQHDRAMKEKVLPTTLLKRELKLVRGLAKKIIKDVAKDYSLEQLSEETGLPQAKLQEGFKLLYARTVTEYIRHVRLEAARDLIRTTDMNISEIVYSIGFSSRSYFSKIFKEKYDISPNNFKNRTELPLDEVVGVS